MAALSRAALCAALLLPSCFAPGEGVEPPLNRIYFPVGIALNVPPLHGAVPKRQPTRLYLVNSDFDLQFNGGSLQSYDLQRIRELVPKYCTTDADCAGHGICASAAEVGAPPWCVEDVNAPCGKLGTKSPADRIAHPGLCKAVDVVHPEDGGSPLLTHSVKIGAFATDIIYREPKDSTGEGRLFVPVRGDSTLHWIDVNSEGELDCGQGGSNECNGEHREGDDPETNTRGLRLPAEPFAIDATDEAGAILVTHQTVGSVSLFTRAPGDFRSPPQLQFVLSGLPRAPVGIAAIPPAAAVLPPGVPEDAASTQCANAGSPPCYEPGFWVAFRNAPEIDLLRYTSDAASKGSPRPFLWRAGVAAIRANSLGFDSRGIAADAGDRLACEGACAPGDSACSRDCAGKPLGVYVANRTPETLLVGRTLANFSGAFSNELPSIRDTIDLAAGPSRVVIGKIIDINGNLATRVFVLCFDSHVIFGYDPVAGIVDTTIWTGRGPHAFAIDADGFSATPQYALGYVAHFTDSYLGVVDLDQRHRDTYGTIVVTLGQPTAPRAQK